MLNIFEWLKQFDIVVNNEDLVRQAFVHSSYANEHNMVHDNERLEFMGDAVLQCWISDQLFHLTPPISEGLMSKLRAKLVCEGSLAECARRLELNCYLYLGSGEEKTGGRNRDSICADMFEAFCGALYLSNGYDAASKVFAKALNDKLAHVDINDVEDFKTKLQEFVQSDTRSNVTYRVINSWGPANAPSFEVEVLLEGIVLGKGIGSSKKKAEQQAAKAAFEKMVK